MGKINKSVIVIALLIASFQSATSFAGPVFIAPVIVGPSPDFALFELMSSTSYLALSSLAFPQKNEAALDQMRAEAIAYVADQESAEMSPLLAAWLGEFRKSLTQKNRSEANGSDADLIQLLLNSENQ